MVQLGVNRVYSVGPFFSLNLCKLLFPILSILPFEVVVVKSSATDDPRLDDLLIVA